jgi:LAS superfamily LD-carboxypeptidase LdcB
MNPWRLERSSSEKSVLAMFLGIVTALALAPAARASDEPGYSQHSTAFDSGMRRGWPARD